MLSLGLLGGFAGLSLEQPGVRGRPAGPQACGQMDRRGGGPLAWAAGALDIPLQGEVPAGEGEWKVSPNVWVERGWEDLNTNPCLSFPEHMQNGDKCSWPALESEGTGCCLLLLEQAVSLCFGGKRGFLRQFPDGDFWALQCWSQVERMPWPEWFVLQAASDAD